MRKFITKWLERFNIIVLELPPVPEIKESIQPIPHVPKKCLSVEGKVICANTNCKEQYNKAQLVIPKNCETVTFRCEQCDVVNKLTVIDDTEDIEALWQK